MEWSNSSPLRRLSALVALVSALCSGSCGQGQAELDAARLDVLIDSLLPEISEASGLEVRQPVQYELQTRPEARAFIVSQLDDEMPPGELAAIERVYRAFGLIPESLELRSLLVELLTEQVVGYYDPLTDHLYVVEGASAATAGPVVAHELVHALQDQHADLSALIRRELGNDRQLAAQAAVEGQAMLVMLALQASQATGQKIDMGALPDPGSMVRPALEADNSQFPVFERSPRLIRETLLFPYVQGATFVHALVRNHAGPEPPLPFGELLPESTEQVLDPEGAFLSARDVPTTLELGEAGEWSLVYENNLGQFESSVLMSERLGERGSATVQGWDGDRYALLEGPGGAEALVWYSVWDDGEAADRFVEHYRRWSGSRDPMSTGFGPGTAVRLEVAGRPVVRVIESRGIEPADVAPPPLVQVRE